MDRVVENTRCGGPDREQLYHCGRKYPRSELETINGIGNMAIGEHSEEYSWKLESTQI